MNIKHATFTLLYVALLSCWINPLNAQEENELLSSKKLLKDFESVTGIIEAHPEPFSYTSEAEFTAAIAKVKSSLSEPHTILEFYKKAASIIALLKDGHSSVYLPEKWMLSKRKAEGAFPYEMHLTKDDEMFVIKNFNEGVIPTAAKITAINGITIDSFLNIIDPYVSYEVKNFRNTIIDNNIEKYLYIAFGNSNNTVLEYFTSETKEVTVENMPYKEWKKFQRDNKEERDQKIAEGKPYSYKKVKDGIGLLNIYAFQASDLQNYKIFLNKTFKEIRSDNIHSLMIDIRGNYGGWPKIASGLFHYISDSYFKTMAKSSLKVSKTYRYNMSSRFPNLKSMLPITQRNHYIDINSIMTGELGSFVDEEAFFNEKPETENFEFRGECYLLINRDSYSAASSFASTFQCYQMGTIIGEETGGTKIFYANPIYQKLSKSRITISMSTTKLYTTCYNKTFEGVKPMIEYSPSILELSSDLDMQLHFTSRIIKKVQKKKAMLKEGKE